MNSSVPTSAQDGLWFESSIDNAEQYNEIVSLLNSHLILSLKTPDGRNVYIIEDQESQDIEKGIYSIQNDDGKRIAMSVFKNSQYIDTDKEKVKYTVLCKTKLYEKYRNLYNRYVSGEEPVSIVIFRGKWAGGHVELVNALVFFPKTNQFVTLPVYYSPEQNQYYMNVDTYNQYMKKYGEPYLSVSHLTKDNSDNELSIRSKLNKYGYNVSANYSMTDEARQQLLRSIIDRRLMTQNEISSHIEFLIRMHENDDRYSVACEKWRRDLCFVLDYKQESRRNVKGKVIPH